MIELGYIFTKRNTFESYKMLFEINETEKIGCAILPTEERSRQTSRSGGNHPLLDKLICRHDG